MKQFYDVTLKFHEWPKRDIPSGQILQIAFRVAATDKVDAVVMASQSLKAFVVSQNFAAIVKDIETAEVEVTQ